MSDQLRVKDNLELSFDKKINREKFVDDGRNERQYESFQFTTFKDLDLIRRKTPISFFRSDFRGAKFTNCKFSENDFSRCDFISIIMEDSSITNCCFKSSAILNSQFRNVIFNSNRELSQDILRSTFYSCNFKNENFSRAFWRDTEFFDTIFDQCSIERTTIEHISFKGCSLKNLNMANMIALDIKFIRSNLEGVIFDPDYLGSYLFDFESITHPKFMYMDKIFELNVNNLSQLFSLAEYMYNNQRFSEAFNISMLPLLINEKSVNAVEFWEKSFMAALCIENFLDTRENISRLFDSLEHYFTNTSLFSITDYLVILKFLGRINKDKLRFDIKKIIFDGMNRILTYIQECEFSYDQLKSNTNVHQSILAHFTFDTDNIIEARNALESIFSFIAPSYETPYVVIQSRSGSIVFEIMTSVVLVLACMKTARLVNGYLMRVILDYKAYKVMTKLMAKAKNVKQIEVIQNKKIFELEKFHNMPQQVKEIFSLLKEIKLFINDGSESRS
jgi:uncharacterized protein YjbI with pentapeptide repeats